MAEEKRSTEEISKSLNERLRLFSKEGVIPNSTAQVDREYQFKKDLLELVENVSGYTAMKLNKQTKEIEGLTGRVKTLEEEVVRLDERKKDKK